MAVTDRRCNEPAHGGSALLALPLEIRTPILKNILVVDQAIPVTGSRDRQGQILNLSILRTCKQIYQEGIILFRRFNVPRMLCNLDHSVPWVMDWRSGRCGPVQNIGYNSFLNDIVPQFASIHIVFSPDPTSQTQRKELDNLRAVVSLLDKLNIRDKVVSMKFHPNLHNALHFWDANGDWVDVIGDMRCKGFSIKDMDHSRIARLIETVEGRSAISDIRLQCRNVLAHFAACQQLRVGGALLRSSLDVRLERDLHRAARITKLEEYERIRDEIFVRCDELIEGFRVKHEELKAVVTSTRRLQQPDS